MSVFSKIREKKEREQEELRAQVEAEKKAHETRVKLSINKTLNRMKAESNDLEKFKQEYIDKARKANTIGNKQAYNFAKTGLKMCLSKQNYIDAMILNCEIALQTNEMNKIINEFVKSISLISTDMKEITSNIDIAKAQTAYETAMVNNESQYEALDAFLKEAESSMTATNINGTEVEDDEIDRLINNQSADDEDDMNSEIDARLNQLKNDLGGTY